MSQASVMTAVSTAVPAAGRQKIEPWTTKELKKEMKENLEFYKRVANGLHVIPPSESYLSTTKAIAQELITRTEKFIEDYDELADSTESKRTARIKPRLCDRALTDLFSRHFKRYLPDNGAHGVLDLNRIAPRAISLYVKDKSLGGSQFFRLDDELQRLFNRPSVEDPTKTYLQLAQERIAEIRLVNGYKPSPSSAEIIVEGGCITMNYSALKIIIPKFGIDYELTNANDYVQQLEEFAKHLEELHNQHEESKKAAKKSTKTK